MPSRTPSPRRPAEENLRWLEVVETRAHLEESKVAHWQVTVKIGVTLES